MNRALWTKAIFDAWRQFVISFVLLTLFSWLFVWVISRFPMGNIGQILKLLPDFVEPLMGVSMGDLATPLGQLSILYVHIVTFLVCLGWTVGRGSDSITGEISRGTMDLILTLPIWRVSVVVIPAVVTAIGSILLSAAVMLGTLIGLSLIDYYPPGSIMTLLPGAVNLACMLFCVTGITTMISAGIRDRWIALAISTGFYVFELLVKMVARVWPNGKWLFYFSFLTPFEPQELILASHPIGHVALRYNLTLVGIGLACYAVAIVIFNRRDIPGPR
jgi:ABC-2 type transport system permease protein